MTRAPGLRAALAAVAVIVSMAAGCTDRALERRDGGGLGGLGNVGGSGTGGSNGTPFSPTRDVDMLFVVDNASSVRLLQSTLLDAFPAFLDTLEQSPAGLPNLHLAVISPDMGAGDGSIPGCSAFEGDAGLFRSSPRGTCTATTLDPGATFISNIDGVTNYTGRLEDVFACITPLGSMGCAFQQPLAAVSRALGADGRVMPDESRGFLRPDAYLFVVVMMDNDDCSVPVGSGLFDTTLNTTLDSTLGPLSTYRCNEFGHLCNGARPPRNDPNGRMDATVTLDGCVSAEGSGMLTPVATLVEQLRSLKGHPDQQILVAAITGPSTPYTVEWRQSGPSDPSGLWPGIGWSCVSTAGSLVDPAVRINQWAASFGANGQTFSACADSFAPALETLANSLAQRLPAPTAMP